MLAGALMLAAMQCGDPMFAGQQIRCAQEQIAERGEQIDADIARYAALAEGDEGAENVRQLRELMDSWAAYDSAKCMWDLGEPGDGSAYRAALAQCTAGKMGARVTFVRDLVGEPAAEEDGQ